MPISPERIVGDELFDIYRKVTGYIGGRLVPRLLAAGCRVRCLVRDRVRLQGRPWQAQVEIAEGDVLPTSR